MNGLEDVGPCRIIKTTDKAVLIDKGRAKTGPMVDSLFP